jgi:hypothetical protein
MAMAQKRRLPTPIQDIALNLVFTVMGESRINRTQQEYAAIAVKIPALKALAFEINELLKWMHKRSACSGIQLPQLCRFEAGDEYWIYEDYPRHISLETVRAALVVAGLRSPRRRC